MHWQQIVWDSVTHLSTDHDDKRWPQGNRIQWKHLASDGISIDRWLWTEVKLSQQKCKWALTYCEVMFFSHWSKIESKMIYEHMTIWLNKSAKNNYIVKPPHNLTSHSTTANRRLPSKQTQVHFIHVCAMRNNRSLSTVFSYSKICIRQMRNSGNLGKNIGKWKTGFVNTRHFSKQRGAVVSKATPVVCGFLFRSHFVVWLRAAWPLGRFQTAIN